MYSSVAACFTPPGLSTTLVAVVKRGVNDQEVAPIIEHALQWKCVRGVTFQPVQDAGRNEGFDGKANRILLTQIRREVAKAGVFGLEDMIPLPCNPDQICIGYGLRDGTNVTPITSLLPRELILEGPNTISYEAYPKLREAVNGLLSLATTQANTEEKLAGLLCCLPQAAVPAELGYANSFRVVILQFLDRYNFDLATVKRSCVRDSTVEGQPSRQTRALGVHIECIDRLASGHEQPVALEAAEAPVAASLCPSAAATCASAASSATGRS
eukprot:gene16421-21760_t